MWIVVKHQADVKLGEKMLLVDLIKIVSIKEKLECWNRKKSGDTFTTENLSMPTDNPKDCRGSWGCGQAGVDSRAGTLNGERAADTEVFMPA